MFTRRLLIVMGLITLLGIGLGAYSWSRYQEDRITEENYRRLSERPTLAEIEALLGRPADHYGKLPNEYKSTWGTMTFWDMQQRDGWRSWIGRKKVIHVHLSETGFCMFMTERMNPTLWDKIRRLFP